VFNLYTTVTGGLTALLATIILGPRSGRFYDEAGEKLEVPREMRGHSPALQMLGTFILWFGWFGFNSGEFLFWGESLTTFVLTEATECRGYSPNRFSHIIQVRHSC